MTPEEFIAHAQAKGLTRTGAVSQLAHICGVGERRVWHWLQGNPLPTYAQRLLDIWQACTPAQRAHWYA